MNCPLCPNIIDSSIEGRINYKLWHCPNCDLVFKDPELRPAPADEKSRYKYHNNNSDNKGYIDNLNLAVKPAIKLFEPGMGGLDYGCGPEPVLSGLVEKEGFECFNYDPIFFPEFPDERMDFIFATETFEHFFEPQRDIKLITALLRPGGILTVMTERWNNLDQLADWWYLRDITHVSFFHKKTFDYICSKFGYSVLYDDSKVIILEKDVVTDRC